MLFMMTITVWSLLGQILTFFRGSGVVSYANGLTAVLLLALAGLLAVESSRALLAPRHAA
jgi:hypothetical protein